DGGDVELPRAGNAGVEPDSEGVAHRASDALLTGEHVGLRGDMAADQRLAGGCDRCDDTGEVLVVAADSEPASQLDHAVERRVEGHRCAVDRIDVYHALDIGPLLGPPRGRTDEARRRDR